MIARCVAIRSGKKSDFADLVRYITGEQGKTERVGQVQVTNCQSDRPDVAITEVLNTQAQNTRAALDKTYHLVISFRPNEQPEGGILKAIEARICAALGYGEHQRVSAVHADTDNLHIHIAINKIHPTRYTMHDPYNDHKTLGRMCEKLEREYCLEQDNHQARKSGAENRAADMESHAGIESLIGWIRRECLGQIQGAGSWAELHQVMRANGLDLHERGNGLVISAGEGSTVKASSVSRDISRGKLEERLGAFVASPERQASALPERQYARRPMRSRFDTAELYARYRNEQAGIGASRTAQLEKASARKNRLIWAAKRSGRLKRSAISLVKGVGLAKRLMYAAVSKTLLAELAEINNRYFRERQEINGKYQRRAWADWLREAASAGEQDALDALRARGSVQGLAGNTVTGKGGHRPARRHPGQDSVTRQGTIIYRVGASAVRDDGSKLKVSLGADQDGLEAALRMARERYGDSISVSGTSAFREQIAQAAAAAQLSITFDDAALERRRQQLTQHATGKESQHEQSKRGRTVGGGFVRSGPAATGAARPAQRGGKPDAGRIGRQPPPQCQNRLRGLSELGVVRFEDGGAVLLPGHVPGYLEQQGCAADHGVRRDVPGTGVRDIALMARDRYIAEREARRADGLAIPRHAGYGPGNDGPAAYAGLRHVGGQALALLRRGGEIMVLPVDEKEEERLRRLAIGDAVTVRAGFIRKKGRSR